MATQLEIANAALRMIGANRISAVDTTTKEGRAVSDSWDMVVKAALSAYSWSFSIKYDEIEAEEDQPAHSWDWSYPVPDDCLRVIDCPDYHARSWQMGSQIGADGLAILVRISSDPPISGSEADDLKIKYVAYIEDEEIWPPCFVLYVAARLAEHMCEDITGSNSAFERIALKRREAMREAMRTNAIEGPPVEPVIDDWLVGRL